MSNWNPNAKVTINGTAYESDTLGGISITYGRTSIWEQPRAGYAVINILNLTNVDRGFNVDQNVTVSVKNSSGTDKTIFTGKVTDISNRMDRVGTSGQIAVQQITAVSPLAKMSRTTISGTFPKEGDTSRLTTILTNAGVTIDTVDSPFVYEFKAISNGSTDAYSLASKYAQQAFGYIYETTTGKVGYANESRRFVEQRDNGYFDIPKNYILSRGLTSSKSRVNLLNDLILGYDNGSSVTSTDATSIASYGLSAGTISTELHDSTYAQQQADRYIVLRSQPRTSIGVMTIQMDNSYITDSKRDTLIDLYMGKPFQISDLPLSIKNTVYKGFVEGWNWIINRNSASLSINSSDSSLWVTPTRWQDVSATTKWSDVNAAIIWSAYE